MLTVIAGFVPAIHDKPHPTSVLMDCRKKSGNDTGLFGFSLWAQP